MMVRNITLEAKSKISINTSSLYLLATKWRTSSELWLAGENRPEAKFIPQECISRAKTFTQISTRDKTTLLEKKITNKTDVFFLIFPHIFIQCFPPLFRKKKMLKNIDDWLRRSVAAIGCGDRLRWLPLRSLPIHYIWFDLWKNTSDTSINHYWNSTK